MCTLSKKARGAPMPPFEITARKSIHPSLITAKKRAKSLEIFLKKAIFFPDYGGVKNEKK